MEKKDAEASDDAKVDLILHLKKGMELYSEVDKLLICFEEHSDTFLPQISSLTDQMIIDVSLVIGWMVSLRDRAEIVAKLFKCIKERTQQHWAYDLNAIFGTPNSGPVEKLGQKRLLEHSKKSQREYIDLCKIPILVTDHIMLRDQILAKVVVVIVNIALFKSWIVDPE